METTNGVPSQLRKVVLPAGQSPQGDRIFGGLDFILPKDTACWNKENWRSWPSASVAMDQGGDGLSGVHALMYKEELRLNLIL